MKKMTKKEQGGVAGKAAAAGKMVAKRVAPIVVPVSGTKDKKARYGKSVTDSYKKGGPKKKK